MLQLHKCTAYFALNCWRAWGRGNVIIAQPTVGLVGQSTHFAVAYFEAKVHQIRFRLGLRPRLLWGVYSAL